MLEHTLKSDVTARRLEVITETGRRRWFSNDDKARIVGETLVPGAVVSEIARRHGLTPQQVFTWRRQARRQPAPVADDPQFVPAVVDAMAYAYDEASSYAYRATIVTRRRTSVSSDFCSSFTSESSRTDVA
ncbi:transposase [Bradyrhizobium sp. Arg62]|uniref:IS66-like element accessory protein TnpA n=1 Tax=Bradyrhizobium TaxID=374 RepID=UPI001E32A48C|nr:MULTISPECIES: transposase [Bradyrhizobium]MCC8938336.1 transposase [Bradyrhizobium ivorense]MCC8948293.1 transposase [Bradyrhizobium brasilense]